VTPRDRTPEQRRRHRDRALAAHFAGAHTVTIDCSRVVLRSPVLFAGTPLSARALREAEAVAGAELVWGEERAGEVAVVARTPLSEGGARALARHLRAPVVDHALEDLEGVLVGLDDAELETLGLGVVERIDFAARTMTIATGVRVEAIAAVTIGRERYRSVTG
jgi:polynucleotide 5'-kinase involved in rRNA processing